MTTTSHGLKRTEIVAASAGTGKTYRLASQIKAELLGDPPIEPERVVAMTYTRAAAAELDGRVRRALIEAGHPRLARRLGAARIGTVHAVCARIVSDHAFELGLSPELDTLDESRALHTLREALEHEVTDAERVELERLEAVMGGLEWQSDVKRIIDAARLNGLGAADLERCAERSIAGLRALLPEPADAAALEADLLRMIEQVVTSIEPRVEAAKEERAMLLEMKRTLLRKEAVPWPRWAELGDAYMQVLRRFGQEHLKHPRLVEDLMSATHLVFAIAARALESYEERKRAWGVFDFVDQETKALELLRNPALRPRLQEQIGLVVVDELQDTSPLQLAILTELADIAERSCFVGDQKQAIFGFRGTDPALMKAVIDVLDTERTAPLATSYRSRPGLVDLTSSLFAPAFAEQGIPGDRVRVHAKLDVEPPGLGPFLERWRTTGDPRTAAREVAAGVAELLEDPDVRVREGDRLVKVERRHVAVLVRTNDHGAELAEELAAVGVPAVRRRRGLGGTLEARALMAGLSLFLDGKDALAAAEIARLAAGALTPDEWLTRLVTAERGKAFFDHPLVDAVVKAGTSARDAGVVAAVDVVIEAMRLRDVCASWGDAEQRWSNLGALRALATRFVHERTGMGAGATVAGFLARLEELAALRPWDEDPDDEQGEVAGQDAVDVITWHKAKGREWPIVILAQPFHQRGQRAFGVHVESDMVSVDLKDPLRGRWVRYWPSPYGRLREGGLIDVVEQHDVQQGLETSNAREELRLLYVGWTRARDRLVIPGPINDGRQAWDLWRGKRTIFRLLKDARGAMLSEPEGDGDFGTAHWAGHDVGVRLRAPQVRSRAPRAVTERMTYKPLPPTTYAPASLQPSALDEKGEADEPIVLGSPVLLREFADMDTMALLGSAVHGFFAADRPSMDAQRRFRLADALLARFGVTHLLGASDVVGFGDRLRAALEARHPGAVLRREAPITQRLDGGTVVRGIIDLVVDTGDGFIIVDHKIYVTTEPRELSTTFAGQLRAYARALEAATGRKVKETLIHLPLSGVLVVVR
jgi:ATP-dependent exoDNAse (exonuclease V) beta subunit